MTDRTMKSEHKEFKLQGSSKKKRKKWIIGDDGDREWLCEHGVGHGNHVHTCDGCCSKKRRV